jgi:phosphatidylserine decarboxylase
VLNKVDMLDDAARARIERQLETYRKLGYEVLLVSCESGEGLDELKAALTDKISIFVGQSGVGKSSLTNALMPGLDVLTGEISETRGWAHTTTTARLYHFPSGGDLIDSPGSASSPSGIWKPTASPGASSSFATTWVAASSATAPTRTIPAAPCGPRSTVAPSAPIASTTITASWKPCRKPATVANRRGCDPFNLPLMMNMSITDNLKIAGQYCLPKHALSRLVGKLAAAEAGNLTTRVIEAFIKQYQVDMSEALHESPAHYKSFNAFFTRELAGIRPLVEDAMTLALPVDGTVSQLGPSAKVASSRPRATTTAPASCWAASRIWWRCSRMATLPPSIWRPRIITASTCRWTACWSMVFVPGDLFSVNPLTAENVPNLFARNERVVAAPARPMAWCWSVPLSSPASRPSGPAT